MMMRRTARPNSCVTCGPGSDPPPWTSPRIGVKIMVRIGNVFLLSFPVVVIVIVVATVIVIIS